MSGGKKTAHLNDVLPKLANRIDTKAAIPQKASGASTKSPSHPSLRRRASISAGGDTAPVGEEIRNKEIFSDANSAADIALSAVASKAAAEAGGEGKAPKRALGKEITQGHAQYALTYGMMLGIRVTTGRQDTRRNRFSAKASDDDCRELTQDDYDEVTNLTLPPQGSAGPPYPTPPHKLNDTFAFKDYAPNAFHSIRNISGIDEAEYMTSLAGDFNYIEFIANSKSGQFFFYSHDGKYMIKTQSKAEIKLLRRILPQYVDHLHDNPSSLLVRFYGVHRVSMKFLKTKIYFVIMNSVFSSEKTIHVKYDLKGSTIGRLTQQVDADKGHVQKDLNLMQSGRKFNLGVLSTLFHSVLEQDAKFLAKLRIMDYSLLVGIHDGKSALPGRRYSSVLKSTTEGGVGTTSGGGGPRASMIAAQTMAYTSLLEGSPESAFRSYYGGIPSPRGSADIYFLGIIDILQLYNSQKYMENTFRSMVTDGKQISAVDPTWYAERFVKFITDHSDYKEMKEQEDEEANAK